MQNVATAPSPRLVEEARKEPSCSCLAVLQAVTRWCFAKDARCPELPERLLGGGVGRPNSAEPLPKSGTKRAGGIWKRCRPSEAGALWELAGLEQERGVRGAPGISLTAGPSPPVAFPYFVDLQQPELLLNNTVNLYLTTEPNVTVGIWHTAPGSRAAEARGKDRGWYEEALGDAHPVIIYLHGNGAEQGRCSGFGLYPLMGAADFHILALDYRGYGDSSGHPTESGFTTDVLALYDWVKARSGNSSVIFWGHSLGTGSVRRRAPPEPVDAVVLESPYTNIREAAAYISITKVRWDLQR
uniref:Abhydrolase domain containing 12B n=1 Tax=Apteryx owenii TaxID=8824 RepID=A0A8B9NWT8_APTOW